MGEGKPKAGEKPQETAAERERAELLASLALRPDWGLFRKAWEELDAGPGEERGGIAGRALARLPGMRSRQRLHRGETPWEPDGQEPEAMRGTRWIEEIGSALGLLESLGGETAKGALAQALRIGGSEAAARLAESAAPQTRGAEELLGMAEWGLGAFRNLGREGRERAVEKLSESAGRAPERGWGVRLALDLPDPEGASAIRDLAAGRLGPPRGAGSGLDLLKGALALIGAGKPESLRVWLEWMAERKVPLHRQFPQRRADLGLDWAIVWPRGDLGRAAGHRFAIRPMTLAGAALFAGEAECLEALLEAGCPLPSPKAFAAEIGLLRKRRPERSFFMLSKKNASGPSPQELLAEYDARIAAAKARWESLRMERRIGKGASKAPRGGRSGI